MPSLRTPDDRTLSWSEVLEDVKGDSPSYIPKRGTPTCR